MVAGRDEDALAIGSGWGLFSRETSGIFPEGREGMAETCYNVRLTNRSAVSTSPILAAGRLATP